MKLKTCQKLMIFLVLALETGMPKMMQADGLPAGAGVQEVLEPSKSGRTTPLIAHDLAVDVIDTGGLDSAPDLSTKDVTTRVKAYQLQTNGMELGDGSPASFMVVTGGSDDDSARKVHQTVDGGYIVSGYTNTYGAGEEDVLLLKYDASGALTWVRTAGGSENDRAYSVAQTTDDGYVVAGYTESYPVGARVLFLLKYDISGDFIWAKTFGRNSYDEAYSVEATRDGGFVVAGVTDSYGAGEEDVLVLKFASNGTLSWVRTAGGSAWDEAYSVAQTTDDGYVVAGRTGSYGAGGSDLFLLKYNANGGLVWARTAGGSESDGAWSVAQASDGGFIVAGYTYSYDIYEAGVRCDVLLLKYDESGTLLWATTTEGNDYEGAQSVAQTTDGGYVVAVSSYVVGPYRAFLFKFDQNGGLVWARTFRGESVEEVRSVVQASDGGYILTGASRSYGAGGMDVLLIKTDANGIVLDCDACQTVSPPTGSPPILDSVQNVLRSSPTNIAIGVLTPETNSPSPETALPCGRPFLVASGGTGYDGANAVQPTRDGGYIVAGHTDSYGAGGIDIFLLKYDKVGKLVWARMIGAEGDETAKSVAQTTDDGYIVAGHTTSFGTGPEDILLLKFSENGALSWARIAAGDDRDFAYSVAQTDDDGYIVAGYTLSFGAGYRDVLLLKYDSGGTLSWARTAGGSYDDLTYSVAQTTDYGYIVAGYTTSYGANGDGLLLKYDSDGLLTWMLAIGGNLTDGFRSVQQTRDGGYVVAGSTVSYGAGLSDVLLLKFDSDGWLSWAEAVGGPFHDAAYSVIETAYGTLGTTYVVAGETASFGAGDQDAFLLGFHGNGMLYWGKTVGGDKDDVAFSVRQSIDRGYVIAGETRSYGTGNNDVLVIRTDTDGAIPDCDVCQDASPVIETVSPNVSSRLMTKTTPPVSTSSPELASVPVNTTTKYKCSKVNHKYLPLVQRN